jgi:succinate dehydrogenase / fumarate reductase, iron-sulfur subunit
MSMENKKITFKVFRFNSETDYLPVYKSYELEITKMDVVLDVLNRIKWEQDGSLSYRRSCRHGICGSCAVKVNTKPVLACKQNVFELIEMFGEELIIQPQSEKRAVKDLIIDKKDFWGKYDAIKPYLIANIEEHPACENIVHKESAELIDEADYCIQCGSCFYSCPSVNYNENFIGPAAFVKAYRFTSDERDADKKERLQGVNQPGSGVWDCVKCYDCAQACPKGINPIGKITRLHNQIFAEGVSINNVASRHAVGFKDSIEKHGLLDEGELVRYSEGNIGVMKHLPEAFDMLIHGKIVLPWDMPKSENLDEIKTLVENTSTQKF